MCTDAYREALTRDLSSTASSAPGPRQDDLESRGVAAAGAVADSGPAMALVKEATVVSGEVTGQR
jgi:hypothetical protein